MRSCVKIFTARLARVYKPGVEHRVISLDRNYRRCRASLNYLTGRKILTRIFKKNNWAFFCVEAMTVQGAAMFDRYNSQRRDALADIFDGIDPVVQKRLVQQTTAWGVPDVLEKMSKQQCKRSKIVLREDEEMEEEKGDDNVIIVTDAEEKYFSRRRHALGDIYEGVNPELLKRLSPEVEKIYLSEKTCFTNDSDKVAVKIRRSFSMVSENEMLKFNGFSLHARRNGVADISEKLQKFEKKYLRNIYFSSFASPNSVLCY